LFGFLSLFHNLAALCRDRKATSYLGVDDPLSLSLPHVCHTRF